MLEIILGLLPIIGLALLVILIGVFYARSIYKNAGPDEAILVTGRRSKVTVVDGQTTEESGQKVVRGAGVFITPFFQKAHKLSLRSRAIELTAVAQDKNGVTLTVEAVAIVKVGDTEEAIRAAAQRFLGQDKNIDNFSQEVLSGSLRASIGATDVLTIIQRRDELGASVLVTARDSLANQGIDVDSFEIKGITDQNGYIEDLGRAEQAKVRKQAEVAESQATREAREAAITNEQAVAEAENLLALRKAALQLDTDRAAAEAAAAKPLAEAKAQQSIVAEQEQTANRRAELRKAELDAEVKAEADAEAYRLQKLAEAEAGASVARANADRDSRIAAAAAIREEGQAQADAIRAKGNAEAEATKAAADALAHQSDALIQLRMIESLPLIARELAAPMGNIDQLTVISTDGASQLTKNVVSGLTEVDSVLSSTMGVSVRDLLGKFVGGSAAGAAFGQVATSGHATAHPRFESVVEDEPALTVDTAPAAPAAPAVPATESVPAS
ncbi:flotillin family protein [Salinibacterium sp. ZJ450]|uniref:flotillin family protein n=1 Tax=Salinibacterium sp. ZJ450 TaxID=2708338 RepID=UPI001422947C|nr:SPFH domain-containing protein [Salinibacterium sp. ZJ450]